MVLLVEIRLHPRITIVEPVLRDAGVLVILHLNSRRQLPVREPLFGKTIDLAVLVLGSLEKSLAVSAPLFVDAILAIATERMRSTFREELESDSGPVVFIDLLLRRV